MLAGWSGRTFLAGRLPGGPPSGDPESELDGWAVPVTRSSGAVSAASITPAWYFGKALIDVGQLFMWSPVHWWSQRAVPQSNEGPSTGGRGTTPVTQKGAPGVGRGLLVQDVLRRQLRVRTA